MLYEIQAHIWALSLLGSSTGESQEVDFPRGGCSGRPVERGARLTTPHSCPTFGTRAGCQCTATCPSDTQTSGATTLPKLNSLELSKSQWIEGGIGQVDSLWIHPTTFFF